MRILARLAFGFLAVLGAALSPASAQSWPDRQIFFIVPFPAGGGTDAFARPLAAQLDKQLNVRVLIENRGGAGGTLGASVAARAAPDGYTFLVGATHHAIAPSFYANLSYDIVKDLVPVMMISRPPHVVVVNPQKVPATTLKDLAAAATAAPGTLTYGTPGNGTTQHVAAELFKVLTRTQISHVPYRGAGPMMQDLVAGHLHMSVDVMGSSAPQIRSGQIRALAVAAARRVAAFPDVPTAAEAGLPGFEFATWYGIWAPVGTPAGVLSRMTQELETALKAPEIVQAWERNGSDVPSMKGEEFGRFVASEVKRWSEVAAAAGIKPQAP